MRIDTDAHKNFAERILANILRALIFANILRVLLGQALPLTSSTTGADVRAHTLSWALATSLHNFKRSDAIVFTTTPHGIDSIKKSTFFHDDSISTVHHRQQTCIFPYLKRSDAAVLLRLLVLLTLTFLSCYFSRIYLCSEAANAPPPRPAPKPYPTGPHQSTVAKPNKPPPRPAPKPYPSGPYQTGATRPNVSPPRPAPKPHRSGQYGTVEA